MPTLPAPEFEPSKVRPWLRGLAWIIPGCSFYSVMALAPPSILDSRSAELFLALIGSILLCSIFEANFAIPPLNESEERKHKRLARTMTYFVLLQILLIPVILLTLGTISNLFLAV